VTSRTLLLASLVVGCDRYDQSRVSEAEFGGDYVEKLCDEWVRCNEDDGPCPFSPADGTTTGVIEECDFDAEAAQECLDAGWICGMVEGTVVPIDACDEVCG
jgi:hypothetical protein